MNASFESTRKTVNVFSSLLARPLEVQNGTSPAYHVCQGHSNLVLPLKSPRLYIKAERLLAHALFESDAEARRLFVNAFVAKITKATKLSGIRHADPKSLKAPLTQLVDILESHRIESLWERLYTGSFNEMKELLLEETAQYQRIAHTGLLPLMACLDAGRTVEAHSLEPYRHLVVEALSKVEGKSFAATLLVARRFVGQCIDQLWSSDPGAPARTKSRDRITGLYSLLPMLGSLDGELAARYHDYYSHPTAAGSAKSATVARDALEVGLQENEALTQALDASADRMTQLIDTARQKLVPRSKNSQAEFLSHDLPEGTVAYVDVDSPSETPPMSAEDARTALQLSRVFSRVKGEHGSVLDYQGTEIDVASWITFKVTKQVEPIFRSPSSGRRFQVGILLDRSASMRFNDSQRIRLAERAVRILAKALALPYVDLFVWGFQATHNGVATITRFSPSCGNFATNSPKVDGGTPTHIALALGVNEMLARSSAVRHLLVVTDGAPAFDNESGRAVSEPELHKSIRRTVDVATAKNVQVSALILGQLMPSGRVRAECSEEQLNYMFGSTHRWQYATEETLTNDMVRSVRTSFQKYLTSI